MSTDLHELADHMVKLAMRQGMDLAEARASSGWELSVKVRLGETELVQEAGHRGIALRVMKQKRVATSSTSDLTETGLQRRLARLRRGHGILQSANREHSRVRESSVLR